MWYKWFWDLIWLTHRISSLKTKWKNSNKQFDNELEIVIRCYFMRVRPKLAITHRNQEWIILLLKYKSTSRSKLHPNTHAKKIWKRQEADIILWFTKISVHCYATHDPGAVSEGGKKSKRPRKKFEWRKVKKNAKKSSSSRSWLCSPEFFSRPFSLFSALTNWPWVSEDASITE